MTVRVRGEATPEEVVAVLAVLSRTDAPPDVTPYELWRRRRLEAIRDPAIRATARPS